jgi:hypothetical protein
LLNFGALSPNLFLEFSPARQVPEIIKESSKNTKNALFEWLGKETTKCFTKSKYTWNLFSTSGLSQIFKIKYVWKLLSSFSKNTLIPSSEKSS